MDISNLPMPAYNQFDTNDIAVNIPPPQPKDTLLKEGISIVKRLPYWKQFAMLLFAIAMVLFPIGINWMNIQMIKGVSDRIALIFVSVKLCEVIVDGLRELFLIEIGIQAEVNFVVVETTRYALLSKPTTYCHPAGTVIEKNMTHAASSLNRIIEWGMQSLTSTIGQMISSIVLLIGMDFHWYDAIAFVLFGVVFWRVLMPLQKIMTERMEIHRKKYDVCNNLMSFRSDEFQNKECPPEEISGILTDPISYDGKIRPLYTYTFRTIDLTMIAIMYIYAWFLPNDNLFAVKYVLVNTVSSAINSIAQFGTQYHRYCNEYQKYYKLFSDPELKYDEYVEPQKLPEELVLERVELRRGNYVISCDSPISIKQADQVGIQGPSGAGKSTFSDAVMGFIPGISLDNGVNIRAYAHQIVCHLQNAQSKQLGCINIKTVFRSDDEQKIREVLDLFFEQDELKRVLDGIDSEKPFDQDINEKMSGGQKTRFFLAMTLFKAIQKEAKIIFLDEPEQGQDPDLQIKSFNSIYSFGREHGLTIFWITHMRPEPLAETQIVFNTKLNFHKDGRIIVSQ
jgi:ABC-type Mn2+/Zn2+ transport system ATPase subunit